MFIYPKSRSIDVNEFKTFLTQTVLPIKFVWKTTLSVCWQFIFYHIHYTIVIIKIITVYNYDHMKFNMGKIWFGYGLVRVR